LDEIYEKWKSVFPSGGGLPDEAKIYFSPFALWTRIPATKPGPPVASSLVAAASAPSVRSNDISTSSSITTPSVDAVSPTETGDRNNMALLRDALRDYTNCYASILQEESEKQQRKDTAAEAFGDEIMINNLKEEKTDVEDFLRDYLEYRRVKDPAKRMLTSSFGSAWTEEVLDDVLFPKSILHNC
jgi:phycoerythrobilin:ferredoxin oxidoreductase